MTSWTLRQQWIDDGYGNRPQNHSAARRAVRHLRRHANEFHGAGWTESEAWVAGVVREHRSKTQAQAELWAKEFIGKGQDQ